MEVSAREDVAIIRFPGKDQLIVYGGVDFDFQHFAAVSQCIAYRAVDLGDTSQSVGVLDASAVAMGFANLAALEKLAQVRGGFELAVVRTRAMNAFVKCNVSAAKRVE